ncbi:MAG: FKBP-type peptidyl-prolyl cis-trans isomerase [Myxococcaceae bacterium]|nr:FKBP-type peptidyl-prolyl cis-trans isomerase [Myxococcaceae bacterium]MBH2006758.1 FKBP-type peptidyl-prolyl cis-trans isomerase [Myxococcaceae bacterium]
MLRLVGMSLVLAALLACNKKSGASVASSDLKTEIEKVSYILGYSTGKSFAEQSVDVNQEIFVRALKEGLTKDSQPALNEEQMREVMTTFRTNLMEKRKQEAEEAGKKNQKEGEEFLAKNKTAEGVVTLPSGLQYKIVKAGSGERAGKEDSVTVEYTGSLLDGKTFDSTKTRGKPATFSVGNTIPGMAEALQLMPAGSEWELFIPANLAYGAQGVGSSIGPNQVLKFNVQVISIEKGNAEASKAPARR